MIVMRVTKEEILEIVDDTENTQVISTEPHDYEIMYTHVTKLNEKYWMFHLLWSVEEGFSTYIGNYVELTEVEPVEVKTIDWRPVK